MAEQSKFVVIAGRKTAKGVTRAEGTSGLQREATTGRVIVVERMMAVAATEQRRRAEPAAGGEQRQELPEPGVEVRFYRKYTERLLQRYVQMTMEAGRVSSMMGREVLGGKASSYRIHGFDDAVIFRLDVEKCLARLEAKEREVIRRVAIQEYTHAEAAELLGVSLRTLGTHYARALDKLTRLLLITRLLEPLKGLRVPRSTRLAQAGVREATQERGLRAI